MWQQEHVCRLEMDMAELQEERQALLQQGMATEQLQVQGKHIDYMVTLLLVCCSISTLCWSHA